MRAFLILTMVEEFFNLAKENKDNIKFELWDREDPYEFIIGNNDLDEGLEQYSKNLHNVSANKNGLTIVYKSGEIYYVSTTKETE